MPSTARLPAMHHVHTGTVPLGLSRDGIIIPVIETDGHRLTTWGALPLPLFRLSPRSPASASDPAIASPALQAAAGRFKSRFGKQDQGGARASAETAGHKRKLEGAVHAGSSHVIMTKSSLRFSGFP